MEPIGAHIWILVGFREFWLCVRCAVAMEASYFRVDRRPVPAPRSDPAAAPSPAAPSAEVENGTHGYSRSTT